MKENNKKALIAIIICVVVLVTTIVIKFAYEDWKENSTDIGAVRARMDDVKKEHEEFMKDYR